jgi:hypothetical protein
MLLGVGCNTILCVPDTAQNDILQAPEQEAESSLVRQKGDDKIMAQSFVNIMINGAVACNAKPNSNERKDAFINALQNISSLAGLIKRSGLQDDILEDLLKEIDHDIEYKTKCMQTH